LGVKLPPPTEAELDATRAAAEAWLEQEAAYSKVWPDVAEFNAELTHDEKYAILTSTDPAIKFLDRELAMWRGEVHANDARVISGLEALELAGVIDTTRRNEILG
jgi:hypothetical protein